MKPREDEISSAFDVIVDTPLDFDRDFFHRLPKTDLHVHLDGSLRPATMVELAAAARVELPTADLEQLRRYMLVDDAADLEDYLRRFDVTIALLQTPEAIERAAYEMVEDAAA